MWPLVTPHGGPGAAAQGPPLGSGAQGSSCRSPLLPMRGPGFAQALELGTPFSRQVFRCVHGITSVLGPLSPAEPASDPAQLRLSPAGARSAFFPSPRVLVPVLCVESQCASKCLLLQFL